MTSAACEANQQIANETIGKILRGECTVFQCEDYEINRMTVCGKCDRSSVNSADAESAFKKTMLILADRVDKFNEWGHDPELSAIKRVKSRNRYRERHKDQLREKSVNRNQDQRIAKLRRELYGTSESKEGD